MPRLAMLLAVLATLGNVGLLTAAAVAWPGAASRARGGNRVHVAQLEAREGRRCWPLAAPPAPSCDAAARFVDELTAHPEPGGWAVAAEQALACRCLSSLGAHGAFVRLLGQPSTSDATAWAHGPERNRILLASRLVTVEDLPTFSARATEWGYTATSRPESFPDAIRTLRELVVWFDAPETRDRLLVMHAVTSGLAFASSSLDVTDLASHDRAARVFALPALLDACSPARACEDPLVLGGHLASTDVAIATEVVRATRNELERVIRWLEDRWREWAMIQTALVAAQGADEPETSAPLRSRIRTGEIELRGSLPRGLAGRVVRRARAELRGCHEEALAWSRLEGHVRVQFIVSSSGEVMTASIASSSVGDRTLERCLLETVRRWRFQRGHGASLVTLPITLEIGP